MNKEPIIFIDTEDMEERYAEGLYMDYLKEENKHLKDRINKAIEYITRFEDIKAYYSYEENGYEEYNYDEDFKIDLLEILKGDNNEC